MNVTEIFERQSAAEILGGLCASEWVDLLDSLWCLEMTIADKDGRYYSRLDDNQEPQLRSCGICEQVNDTTEFGKLPYFCSNKTCQDQRSFWGYNDEIRRPGRYVRTLGRSKTDEHLCNRARSNWFRSHMKETFGTSSLFDLPKAARLSVLMSMTLERMALEQRSANDKRIAPPPDERNGRSSSWDFDAGSGSCHSRIGSTSKSTDSYIT